MSSAPKSRVRSRRSMTSATISSSSVAVGGAACGGQAQGAEAHRDGARVDDLRPGSRAPTDAAATCAACIVAERRDERLMQTMPVAPAVDEAAESRLERAGRRCRGLGQHARAARAAPRTRRRAQLFAVDELVVAEADRERHDLDPVCVDQRWGRSQALSVTTRMPRFLPSSLAPSAAGYPPLPSGPFARWRATRSLRSLAAAFLGGRGHVSEWGQATGTSQGVRRRAPRARVPSAESSWIRSSAPLPR